jgi:predicted acyl esterase
VGGWADGYSNAIFRMLAAMKCPRLGLIGPWGHKYPHNGMPGPAIGFLQEAKRWWDHWLKGIDTGIMREPMLRAWVQESVPPAAHYDVRPGYWVGETAWPGPTVVECSCALGSNTLAVPALSGEAGRKASSRENSPALAVASPQSVGQHAGEWCPYGMGGLSPELPLDQREEDGGSLVFDTDSLTAAVTILGAPVVELDLESDQPAALVAVRLNDLRPDGSDLRVSYGVLNLTHRNGHDRLAPLEPGKRVRVRVQMNEIGHIFPAGHRIRLAISTAYWPTIWPSPRPVRLLVHTDGSQLVLPIRERQSSDERVHFEPPAQGRATARTVFKGPRQERTVTRDVAANEVIYTVLRDEGRSVIDEIGVESGFEKKVVYRIKPDDPTSARVDLREAFVLRHRQGWDTFVEAQAALSSTENEFLVEASLKAFDRGKPFFAKSWLERIPRKGV